MTEKCKNCKYYIKDKTVNNCSQNVVGTVHGEDSACYKITDTISLKKINTFYDI